ncbi:ABC transporter permease [Halolamina sp.]|jgi:ABC-type spermidine/putrescine transport system permease subunit I|uniref:ABC transporter permease n=1 Tax=Halolamina sp. TaxID=1940283 RepID=UPI000223BF9A|nr:ABC-type transporter, integral membrane subunit [halophilic archaeon DL31]
MIIKGLPIPDVVKRYGSPRALVALGLGFLGVAYVVPILLLYWQSLNFGDGGLFIHYESALSGIYLQTLLRSFYYGILTTVVTLSLGYVLAYYIAFRAQREKFLLGLVVLPLWIAYVIRYLGIQLLLFESSPLVQLLGTDFGILFSTRGVIIGLTSVFLPFAILPIYHALNSIEDELISASRTLGAGQLRTIRSVIIPLSLSGIVAGGLIVFILATGSFLAPAILGSPGDTMIANVIQGAYSNFNVGLASSLAVIYTTLLLVVIMAFNSYVNIGRVLGEL